jgi:hypothetical protein
LDISSLYFLFSKAEARPDQCPATAATPLKFVLTRAQNNKADPLARAGLVIEKVH